MKNLQGKTASAGIAAGKILLMQKRPDILKQEVNDPQREAQRLRDALYQAESAICAEKENADKAASGILDTHLMLLSDAHVVDTMTGMIGEERCNAEYAAFAGGEKLAKEFEQMDNAYMRARSEDMRHIAQRVTDCLTGYRELVAPPEPVILCAEEFTPALLNRLDKSKVLGLAARKGSLVSHTALLAAGYGLPYLINVDIQEIRDGENAILDTDQNALILSPDEKTLAAAKKKETAWREMLEAQPEKTQMKIYANIASEKDLDAVLKFQADGVGLFRTEFLFMNRDEAPDEEEQFGVYRRVLEKMGGREVIIRTIDAGTDKPIPYLNMPKEENPALGLRGARVSLHYPELFRDQLRALLRAACYGNEGIMFPMIASGKEIDRIREQIEIAAHELDERGEKYALPHIGIMVETPAAAVISETLGAQVDFFSIGTNDLTQYTLALDRLSEGMDDFYDAHHEAVLGLIRMTIDGGHKNGIPVGICGKLGADQELLPLFVKAGLDEVSVPAASIPAVRKRVAELEKEAEEAVAETTDDNGICAAADGRLVQMSDIPDPVFAGGVLGACFGIIPDTGLIKAPVSGTVTNVAETGHAICIRTLDGKDVLVHAGIDTVKLNGKGFAPAVKKDDQVTQGQKILSMDLDLVKQAGFSTMVITVLMN